MVFYEHMFELKTQWLKNKTQKKNKIAFKNVSIHKKGTKYTTQFYYEFNKKKKLNHY